MTIPALLLAVAAMLCWASTWVLMKAGVDRMSMIDFGFLRPWLGLPFIAAYAAAVGGLSFGTPGLVLLALGTGVLNAFVGTLLFYYALRHGALHETNILANTNPFWGVVSAIVILGDPVSPVTIGAGALVVAGTVFLVRGGDRAGGERRTAAVAAALGTGLVWGFSSAVPTKHCLNEGMSPIAFQLLFTAGAAAAWSVAILPRVRRGRVRLTRRGVAIALLSAVLGLFAGWVLWLLALERASASALSPLIGLILLFATILGAFFYRERLTRRMALGGLLVLAGVTLVSAFAP